MKIVGPSSYSLITCCVKISKKKNENSISSELSKISTMPKIIIGSLGINPSKYKDLKPYNLNLMLL